MAEVEGMEVFVCVMRGIEEHSFLFFNRCFRVRTSSGDNPVSAAQVGKDESMYVGMGRSSS